MGVYPPLHISNMPNYHTASEEQARQAQQNYQAATSTQFPDNWDAQKQQSFDAAINRAAAQARTNSRWDKIYANPPPEAKLGRITPKPGYIRDPDHPDGVRAKVPSDYTRWQRFLIWSAQWSNT